MQTKLKTARGKKVFGNRLLLAAVAILLAIALLAAGTLAFSNFTESALNPFEGFVANGTRLHDDYNGVINQRQNPKDVYVENFGTTPLLVRIRFTEYFEVGGDTKLGGAKNDTSTWIVRTPDVVNAASADWGWTMGGQKWYLPTENLDDIINGVTTGPNAGKPDNIIGRKWFEQLTGTDLETKHFALANNKDLGTVTTVNPFTAASENTAFTDNIYEDSSVSPTVFNQKTVKQTANATVVTMADWIAGGRTPGDYWVADKDGWYYWANYLAPDHATGLLLHQVDMLRGMVDDYYYGVNAELQSATYNEVYKFGEDGNVISNDARELIHYATKTFAYEIQPVAQSINKVFTDASGVKWRVLDVNPTSLEALIVREQISDTGAIAFHSAATTNFTGSTLATALGSGTLYTPIDATLKSQLPATAKTIQICQATTNVLTAWSAGKVFLLGDYDVFGTTTPGDRTTEATTKTSDGWVKGAPYFSNDSERVTVKDSDGAPAGWWVRSAYDNTPDAGVGGLTCVAANGERTHTLSTTATGYGARPAMFIEITKNMKFPNE